MSWLVADVVFVIAGLSLFRFVNPVVAALTVFLGGWVLLPVGPYPADAAGSAFPYWITGLALPAQMGWTKAWIAPAVALVGWLVFGRPDWRRLRPRLIDLPIAAWCLWPLLQSLFVEAPRPGPWASSLYLTGCWGLPWLFGRLCFSRADRWPLLALGLALASLACLPFSLIESAIGPVLYGWVYEPHPFRLDGAERYVGFRPIGFFEHGNQFGLWVALGALCAVWLALSTPPTSRSAIALRAVAVATVAMALAAQSVGAVLLLIAGVLLLSTCRWLRPRVIAAALAGLLIVCGAAFALGAIPSAAIGRDTALGQRVIGELRSVGRISFAWRIGQDLKLLPVAMAHPVVGAAEWDWWRERRARPWDLALLEFGQFGAIGLGLSLAAALTGALRTLLRAPRASAWSASGVPLLLATLVCLAATDALMNSFVYFPAILIAGALARPTTAGGAVPGSAEPRRPPPAG